MVSKIKSLAFFTFSLNSLILSVCPQKYNFIGNCKSGITFICGETDRTVSIFGGFTVNCYDGYYQSNYRNDDVEEIHFDKCRFQKKMVRIWFKEFPNLNAFDISNVELELLSDDIFQGAQKLTNFTASHNRLTEIPANLFVRANTTSIIDLSNNAIERIDAFAFEVLNDLKYLDLSNNKLTSFNVNIFKTLSKLEDLQLSYNPIGDLKNEIFYNLIKLERLQLRRTNISIIESDVFKNLRKLTLLDLSENHLKRFAFERFSRFYRHLHLLRLGSNQLEDMLGIENGLLTTLKVLDIQNNKFNCSYLEKCVDSIQLTECCLETDSFDVQRDHFQGINCDPVNDIVASTSN